MKLNYQSSKERNRKRFKEKIMPRILRDLNIKQQQTEATLPSANTVKKVRK